MKNYICDILDNFIKLYKNVDTLDKTLCDTSKMIRKKKLTLYRYREINDFTKDEIKNKHIYLNKINNFDDIVDSRLVLDPPSIEAYKLNEYGTTCNINNKNLKERFAENKKAFDKIISNINEIAEDYLRIACFSKTKNNGPMWYFYANHNKGLCIEYEITPNDDVALFPVTYDSIRIDSSRIKYPQEMGILNEVIKNTLIKNKDWQFEKEWRIISLQDENANTEKYQENMKIKAIYFGSETTKNDVAQITQIVQKDTGIKLYKMNLGQTGKLEYN